jgi:branched-chain amino acid transport system ATP-binding protein
MLELSQVTAGYGAFTALWDVSLRVNQGEAVAVVGPNGAGKTTLLRAISGLIAPRAGRVTFEGAELAGNPAYDIVAHGIAHVPEGRRLFPQLTVAENLKMGAFLPPRAPTSREPRRVYTLFPVLAGISSAPGACRAASSRCSPSAGRSCRGRSSSCSTSRRWAWRRSWCCGCST